MTTFTPEQMQSVLEDYQRRRARIHALCEKEVVKWRVATDQMMRPLPLYDQVDRELEGAQGWIVPTRRWLRSTDQESSKRHGFDRAGKLRVYDETRYYLYHQNLIDEITYSKDEEAADLTRYVVATDTNQVLARFEICGINESSFQQEEFTWRDGQLSQSVQRTWLSGDDGKLRQTKHEMVYRYEFDSQGRLLRGVREQISSGKLIRSTVVFKRPVDRSLTRALADIENFLVDHVPKAVAEMRLTKPLFAVLLTYDDDDIAIGWARHMALVFDDYRRKMLASSDGIYRLWCECEMEMADTAHDTAEKASRLELEDKLQAITQLVEADAQFENNELRRSLCRVALRLNQQGLGKVAPLTDDFVVVALEEKGASGFDQDFNACVPTERIALLRSRGLLP